MTAISATNVTNYPVAEPVTTQTDQYQSTHNVENNSYPSSQDGTNSGGSSPDFATVFSNTVEEQNQPPAAICASGTFCINGASGVPGVGMMPGMGTGFTDPLITDPLMQNNFTSAVSSTNSNDQMAQMMLMMMMLMMQGGGGDMSMLPAMMSSFMSQANSTSQNFNNNSNMQMNAPFTQPTSFPSLDSQFNIETNNLGGMATSSVMGFGSATLPLNVGIAATPVVTSNIHNRSPERYRAVLDQFQVETAERYRPGRDGFTYCNIFVLDVVRAMGAHIPHLGAINMCNWLGTTGRQHGWREVDAATAQAHANTGRPAVTSAGSIGHVQMVVPSRTPFNPERGVSIAQAGRINTNYAPISTIYGGNTLHTRIRYFVHD